MPGGSLLYGASVLTLTGLTTQLIGFIYRILLSRRRRGSDGHIPSCDLSLFRNAFGMSVGAYDRVAPSVRGDVRAGQESAVRKADKETTVDFLFIVCGLRSHGVRVFGLHFRKHS